MSSSCVKKHGKKLLEQGPSNDELISIIRDFEQFRKEAWHKLLEQDPSNKDLMNIIGHVPSLRKEARELLKREPSVIIKAMRAALAA